MANNSEFDEPEHLRKIFIGGLTSTTTDEGLQSYFEKWGTVVDAVVMKDPNTKKSRGFGFITYSESSMVEAAQNARPHTIDGRTIEAKRAVPRDAVGRPEVSGTTQKIFIGRLGNDFTEDDLKAHFSEYGNVVGVNIVKDKDGNSRGFGFVEFDDYDPVDRLVLQSDHTINGKVVDVKKSHPKQKDNDSGNRSGGGGGNQGGFRGNNAGGVAPWGRNSGDNFNGRGNNYGGGNSGFGGSGGGFNSAWNNPTGNFGGNNANGGGGNWSGYGGGNNPGNNFGGGGGFGNAGGNFGGGNNMNNQRNFGGNANSFDGSNQMQKGPGSGPVRGANMGNRQRPYGNRNFGGAGGRNFNN